MPMPTVPSTKILDSAKSQVGYNVELLEGAILHVLQICGCLSAESLDRFALIYAYKHGKQLRTNFASSYLLPRMRDANKIWQVDKLSFYTASPIIKMDRQIQDGRDAASDAQFWTRPGANHLLTSGQDIPHYLGERKWAV